MEVVLLEVDKVEAAYTLQKHVSLGLGKHRKQRRATVVSVNTKELKSGEAFKTLQGLSRERRPLQNNKQPKQCLK